MKEYGMMDLTGIDDESAEEIAYSVNGLTKEDRDRIFNKCMVRMKSSGLTDDNSSESVMKVKKDERKNIIKAVKYISAAALVFVTVGVAAIVGNRMKRNSDLNENILSYKDAVTDITSAGPVSEVYSEISENSRPVTSVLNSETVIVSESSAVTVKKDVPETEDLSYYRNVFESLKENFDLAYLMITGTPVDIKHGANLKISDSEGYITEYSMVKDKRVKNTDDVRNVIESVFSERYLDNCMNDLFGGETPKYMMYDGELYVQDNAHGWEYEWKDDEAKIENISENSFATVKKRLYFSSEVYEFRFEIVRQGENWRIDSFSYDSTGEKITTEFLDENSDRSFAEIRAESLVNDYFRILPDMQNPETDVSEDPFRVIVSYENGISEELDSYPVLLHKSAFNSFSGAEEEYGFIFSDKYLESQKKEITGADDGRSYKCIGPYFEKDGILYGISYSGKGFSDYTEIKNIKVYDITDDSCTAETEAVSSESVSVTFTFDLFFKDGLWKIDSLRIS